MELAKYRSVMTALATPMVGGQVDLESLKRLVSHQMENGVQGFIVNGTTGESPTLIWKEQKRIFDVVRASVGRELPLIFGSGTNSTATSIELSQKGVALGADALLVVVPYYNKPPQRGLLQHFKKIADEVSLPLFLYNVPGRTVASLQIETIRELSKHPNIIGIKEASGDLELAKKIRTECGEDFIILSGDDPSCVELIRQGGDGVISVLSHVIPKDMVELCHHARSKSDAAVADFKKYDELNRLLFCEANPIPVKEALFMMGLFKTSEARLPLVSMDRAIAQKLKEEMKKLGIINV